MDVRTPKKISIWSYYLACVLAVLISLGAITWYSIDRYRDFFTDQLKLTLEDRASQIAAKIVSSLKQAPGSDLVVDQTTCQIQGSIADVRLTVVANDGVVKCDSNADITQMGNHDDRPEIVQAIQGRVASSTRYSETLATSLLYVAVPAGVASPPEYVVRAAIPLSDIDNLLAELLRTLTIIGIVFAFLAMILSVFLYQKINPPLKDIVKGAYRFAHGKFGSKLPGYQVREVDDLAHALNQMASQLELLETIRQDFVSNVSHELKTPITSIKGFVETLMDGAKEEPQDLDRFLKILSRQSDRLDAIVDDLLTLSKLESEPASQLLNLHSENMDRLLGSVAELCQNRAENKDIKVSVEVGSNLQAVCDRSLMIQALTNLVDNAIKYSDSGTEVRLQATESGIFTRLSVIDQGPGVSPEHIPRLFERFYRVDKARSRNLGGTGLGLAIVKHIAVLHGGGVSVEGTSEGSTFTFDIPTQPLNG